MQMQQHLIIIALATTFFIVAIIILALEQVKPIQERNKLNIYSALIVSFACFFMLLIYAIVFLFENIL